MNGGWGLEVEVGRPGQGDSQLHSKFKGTWGEKTPLKLELWVVVSHHVVTGNRIQLLYKTNKYTELLRHLPSPGLMFLKQVHRRLPLVCIRHKGA